MGGKGGWRLGGVCPRPGKEWLSPSEHPSVEDTYRHVLRVKNLMDFLREMIRARGVVHDKSKFYEPELQGFDKLTPKLKACTYGSDEYKGFLAELKPVLDHHYANNKHHPEFHPDGIDGMDIVDLVELICDWKAASERHKDGDLVKSIQFNKARFKMSDQLEHILLNTAKILVGAKMPSHKAKSKQVSDHA